MRLKIKKKKKKKKKKTLKSDFKKLLKNNSINDYYFTKLR